MQEHDDSLAKRLCGATGGGSLILLVITSRDGGGSIFGNVQYLPSTGSGSRMQKGLKVVGKTQAILWLFFFLTSHPRHKLYYCADN
jgi:hypothetical protein